MNQTTMSIQASSNGMMANYLSRFEIQAERAARQNLQTALESGGIDQGAYTQPELRAIIKLEQLKLIGDLGLAEVLLRGKIIREIENEALWSIHPNSYTSMQEAAKDQGISISEYSNIRDLYNIVFPYLSDQMGLNLPEIWEEIGKSNFRELCPYLVRIITGNPSSSRHVETAYSNLIDDIEASNAADELSMTEDEMRQTSVERLLEAGHLPNRQLRQRIRPRRPAAITVHVVDYQQDGTSQKALIALVDEEQFSLIQARLNSYIRIRPKQMVDIAHSQLGRMIMDAQ